MMTFPKTIIPGAGNSRVVLRKALSSDFFVLFFNWETLPLPGAILVFNQDIDMKNDGGICRANSDTKALLSGSPHPPFLSRNLP